MQIEVGDLIQYQVDTWYMAKDFVKVTENTNINNYKVLAIFKPIGDGQYKKVWQKEGYYYDNTRIYK